MKKDYILKNFIDDTKHGMIGNGIIYNGNKFITHSNLHYRHSAIRTIYFYQKLVIFFIFIIILFGIITNLKQTIIFFIVGITALYFIDILFNLFLIIRSFQYSPEIRIKKEELQNLHDNILPIYTIFCPLYKEWEVAPQFVKAISNINWPKDKLDVQLLLEEDDEKTIQEIKKIVLPSYFRIVVIPYGQPKTKPKACNYGLCHARGEYAVIFDAEDVPDPDQLKKAFIVFQKSKEDKMVCVQAKLNFYNHNQNILTRLFSAEYTLWFDLILPGLQSIKSPIPLGGTSNHFRTKDLHVLNGWDPFNVTEDCDLGMRICKAGYYTVIFDSYTMEEATSKFGNWIRQRSRWIKGYMQTYLIHMRRPNEFITDLKNLNFLTFQLIVGGKIVSMFINPIMWMITVLYFIFRPVVGPTIESFFPLTILYLAVFSLVIGNFLYMYYYMIGCLKREQGELVKYAFFVPFYWLMISVSAWKAFYQLITKPHYWEKTVHGFHLSKMKGDLNSLSR